MDGKNWRAGRAYRTEQLPIARAPTSSPLVPLDRCSHLPLTYRMSGRP